MRHTATQAKQAPVVVEKPANRIRGCHRSAQAAVAGVHD